MVRFRVGIDEGPKDVKDLANILLKDDDTFRAVVQKYVTEAILPRSVDSVSTAYSSDNKGLITTLIGGGESLGLESGQHYCKACANLAISAASKIRKLGDDDDDFDGVYDFSCGDCSSCN